MFLNLNGCCMKDMYKLESELLTSRVHNIRDRTLAYMACTIVSIYLYTVYNSKCAIVLVFYLLNLLLTLIISVNFRENSSTCP